MQSTRNQNLPISSRILILSTVYGFMGAMLSTAIVCLSSPFRKKSVNFNEACLVSALGGSAIGILSGYCRALIKNCWQSENTFKVIFDESQSIFLFKNEYSFQFIYLMSLSSFIGQFILAYDDLNRDLIVNYSNGWSLFLILVYNYNVQQFFNERGFSLSNSFRDLISPYFSQSFGYNPLWSNFFNYRNVDPDNNTINSNPHIPV